ncbi:MAG: GyrI-like domain-containing protein [Myxococcales bacterium]|nr:GyrI-like domain-containing protein [Myxococcales bacterium]USN49896.1 MAG: GyrI-like domain-containing protein [Myxococcales bacterium]
MKSLKTHLGALNLVGIKVRTNNTSEMDPKTAQIGKTIEKFLSQKSVLGIASQKSSKMFCVYTDYESDEHGDYTYFVGVEVDSFDDIPLEFEKLIIEAQDYIKFTSDTGQMPEVVIDMWMKIWQMDSKALGGERSYYADFEIYDERSCDPQKTVLDIFIGIK